MYYYDKAQNGEIVTLLTIVAVVTIGISTVISSLFLKNSKNKIATNSRAMFDCEAPCGCNADGSEKACPNDNNNSPPDNNPQPPPDNQSPENNPPPPEENQYQPKVTPTARENTTDPQQSCTTWSKRRNYTP